MLSLKNLLVLATGATALVIPRDVAQVESDLMTINSDVQSLAKAANSYTGGLFGALPIENAESKTDKDINSATDDANASDPATDAQAQTIIDYINNTLEPSIESAITAIENKKSQLTAAGLKSEVQNDLSTLKSDTDSFGQALINKAPSDKDSAAQAALAKIDDDFAGAISYFSS